MACVACDGHVGGGVNSRASNRWLLLEGFFKVKLLDAGSQSVEVEEGVFAVVDLNSTGPVVRLEALVPNGGDIIVDVGL